MKKIHVVGLTLFVVFALSALTASSALAVSQWLVEGKTLAAPIAAEAEGLLEIIKYESNNLVELTALACEGILDGTIGPGAKDMINDVLNLSMETIGELESPNELALSCVVTFDAGAVTDCKAGSVALVWLDNLNLTEKWGWEGEVVLSGATFLGVLGKSTRAGKFPGYEVECESLFLGVRGTELCENEGPVSATLTNDLATPIPSVLGTFTPPTEMGGKEYVNCTMTGAESGSLEGFGNIWAIGAELEELETSVSDV
jgi:hypothetical protein